jgi:hypothetical protein
MKITQFFEDKLGAKLKNPYWSWGAVDREANLVFLRVWKDHIESDKDGQKVQVYWKKPRNHSNGYAERLEHLKAVENGAQAIGILCQAVDSNSPGKRTIKSYDENQLLLLGSLSEDERFKYARVVGHISIDELKNSTLATDIKNIVSTEIAHPTTLQTLVDARVGQGKFRSEVLHLWNHRCAVTGSSILDAIRASHIKPWRDSTDFERLDPNNGLPLVANLDALFDAGLISFSTSGEMLVSSKLSDAEREIFDVMDKKLSKPPSSATAKYLIQHRAKFSFL